MELERSPYAVRWALTWRNRSYQCHCGGEKTPIAVSRSKFITVLKGAKVRPSIWKTVESCGWRNLGCRWIFSKIFLVVYALMCHLDQELRLKRYEFLNLFSKFCFSFLYLYSKLNLGATPKYILFIFRFETISINKWNVHFSSRIIFMIYLLEFDENIALSKSYWLKLKLVCI